jgi:hypothetical protein
MKNFRWVTTPGGTTTPTQITYFFPTSTTDYGANYSDAARFATFKPVTPAQQAAIRDAFALITSYTGISFVPAAARRRSRSRFGHQLAAQLAAPA